MDDGNDDRWAGASGEDALLSEPVREFAQVRARRTYERLIRAAGKLFDERGFDATQTPDIAASAGLSVGTFYRYFPDKQAIYVEVMRRDIAEAYHAIIDGLTPERFVGKGRRSATEEAIALLLAHVTRTPRRQRVFLEMALRDPQVAALRDVYDDAARKRLTGLIAAVSARADVPDPEATAHIVYTTVMECARHIAGIHGPFPLERERAMAALTALVLRTLFPPES